MVSGPPNRSVVCAPCVARRQSSPSRRVLIPVLCGPVLSFIRRCRREWRCSAALRSYRKVQDHSGTTGNGPTAHHVSRLLYKEPTASLCWPRRMARVDGVDSSSLSDTLQCRPVIILASGWGWGMRVAALLPPAKRGRSAHSLARTHPRTVRTTTTSPSYGKWDRPRARDRPRAQDRPSRLHRFRSLSPSDRVFPSRW